MLKRIVTAVVCIAIFIPVLIYSETWIFPAVLGALSLLAVFEVTSCLGLRRKYLLSGLSLLLTGAVFLLYCFVESGTATKALLAFGGFAVYLYLFFVFAITMFSRGNTKFSQVAQLVSLTLYITAGFLSIVLLRRLDMGSYLYLLVFIGSWMTDTGAYFVGMLLGKHKLIPEVSPKKTIEGAFGGILGCILGYAIYGVILQYAFAVQINYLLLCVLAAVIAVVSQIGDLIASYVKRECGIKDYGFIFPGHGGVMDRFDSVIAVAPFIFLAAVLLMDKLPIFS